MAGVLGQVGPEEVVAEAEALGRLLAGTEGADVAADAVTEVGVAAAGLDDLRLAWRIGAVARRHLDLQRRDATWVWLRTWELDEGELDDTSTAGVPTDSPERAEVRAVAARIPDRIGNLPVYPVSRAQAEAELAADIPADRRIALHLQGAGRYRDAVAVAEEVAADADRRGLVARAVEARSDLVRIHNVLGNLDAALDHGNRAMLLLPRLSIGSRAMLRLFAAFGVGGRLRGDREEPSTREVVERVVAHPDYRWAGLAMWAARAQSSADLGRVDDAIEAVEVCLPGIERAGASAPAYPLIVNHALAALWWLDRTDHLDVLERNLKAKVVEPDVRYVETDGRWDMARAAALRGDDDQAREWFAEGRAVLREEGARTLLVALDGDEALMEMRLGNEAAARALVDGARSEAEAVGLTTWCSRLDEIVSGTAPALR